MKVVQQYEFTEEDKKLLRTPLPECPCDKCGARFGECCGCPDEKIYQERVKPYKDNNIYDIALNISRRHNLTRQVNELQQEIASIEDKIPEEIRDGLF